MAIIKPPIGIKPLYLDHDTGPDTRKQNLLSAIVRYKQAGLAYPKEWDVEIYVRTDTPEADLVDIFQSDIVRGKNLLTITSHLGPYHFYEKSLSARKLKRLKAKINPTAYFVEFGSGPDAVRYIDIESDAIQSELSFIYMGYGVDSSLELVDALCRTYDKPLSNFKADTAIGDRNELLG